ncbi:hypothetical protein [Rhizobium leguminosarum]|uniref:hypothetical protein n=1 Tax=Rhizobium leguminosarum TaxID=384 RepID=UPI0004B15896|nr:hypothetical protein [Rhizobium leguminosarum]
MTTFTPAIYGAEPKDLGRLDLDTAEMMFWLYTPIKLPGMWMETPPQQLVKYDPLLDVVRFDVIDTFGEKRWTDSYVYLSVKILHVTPDAPGNRPGWHSDGFMTNDLNYIWSDRNPTEFFIAKVPMSVRADHSVSLVDFELEISQPLHSDRREHATVNHLYRLDQTNIHRVSLNVESGKRAFIKVSVSDKPYAQLGNSINHDLPAHPRPSVERIAERNCPQGKM